MLMAEGDGASPPVAIQTAMAATGASALAKYQDLVVGSRSLGRLMLYELVTLLATWTPGALGLVLRKLAYPLLLGRCGRNVVFGHGVVLRHPAKIRIGDGVVVDDLVLLDAKGTHNHGITLGNGVFLGRGTILSCKDGDIELGDQVNLGFNCEIFSGSRVVVGAYGLFAAQTYVIGGGHHFASPESPCSSRPARRRASASGRTSGWAPASRSSTGCAWVATSSSARGRSSRRACRTVSWRRASRPGCCVTGRARSLPGSG